MYRSRQSKSQRQHCIEVQYWVLMVVELLLSYFIHIEYCSQNKSSHASSDFFILLRYLHGFRTKTPSYLQYFEKIKAMYLIFVSLRWKLQNRINDFSRDNKSVFEQESELSFFVLARPLSTYNGGVTAWPNQSRDRRLLALLENNKEKKSSYFFRCEKEGGHLFKELRQEALQIDYPYKFLRTNLLTLENSSLKFINATWLFTKLRLIHARIILLTEWWWRLRYI